MGMYPVTLKSMATNGCKDEKTMNIDIWEKPTASFIADDVCAGSPVEFLNESVSTGNLDYSWDFGDGNTGILENPVKTYNTAGTYQVSLVVKTAQGCTDTAHESVVVKVLPLNTITQVVSGEKGDGSIVFTASVPPGSSYIWFFGDGAKLPGSSTSGSVSTVYRYMLDANYDVSLHVTKDGCTGVSTVTVPVYRNSTAGLDETLVKVYPNPSNGLVNIDLGGLDENAVKVEVYASSGQLVKTISQPGQANLSIDLGTEPAGIYLLKVHTETAVYAARVAVNR
jgi:PKD repeat protein